MRILLYDNSHLPAIGGREIVVYQLATWYQKLGHEVVLVGPGGLVSKRSFKFSYPVYRFASSSFMGTEAASRWQFRLRGRPQNFDVIHAHMTYPCAFIAAQVIQEFPHDKRPAFIVTPHGADIHKIPEINHGKRLDEGVEQKINWTLQQADYATAISQSVRHSLVDAGMPDSKIIDIANGVDAARFQTHHDLDIFAELDLPANAKLFVTVGNYHPRKGHAEFVDAINLLSKSHPDVCGVIVGRKHPDLEAKVADLQLQDHIKFTGMLKYPMPGAGGPDILAALHAASLGYVSAAMNEGSEGLSLALLEAMSAGLCMVATKISGNRDIISDRKNGLLVEPGSPSALAEAMGWVLDHPEEAKQLGKAAATTVGDYSWQAIAQQYLELFTRTIAETAADNSTEHSQGAA